MGMTNSLLIFSRRRKGKIIMKRSEGNTASVVWLVADSNPGKSAKDLAGPLDSRHPTRHNIWTPILRVVNRHLFRQHNLQLDDEKIYIRNAVEHSSDWGNGEKRGSEIAIFSDLIKNEPQPPPIVLTFGTDAYEFARWAYEIACGRALLPGRFEKRKVTKLHEVFNDRTSDFRPDEVNILPLLHAVVARGKTFLHCHQNFSGGKGNYFDYAGERIARLLIEHRTHPRLRSVLIHGALPINPNAYSGGV
jgi:hypothetical protein